MITIDYDTAIDKQYTINYKELIDNLDDKSLNVKINNWCTRHKLPYDLVKDKVKTDFIFARFFVKDPMKQGIHEKVAANVLQELPFIKDFKVLPKQGFLAKRIVNGVVLSDELSKNTSLKTKSIDFKWTITTNKGIDITCYASHKYTKSRGGNQDNQYTDLRSFMEHARQNHDKNTRFFAICDGEYYKYHNNQNKSKTRTLNDICFKRDKVVAAPIIDLYDIFKSIIND
jgi:hypothetical protein